MRWTLILATLAAFLLLAPAASTAAVIPGSKNFDGHFALATGQSKTFTMTVYKQQTGGELVLDVVFDRAAYASGFHVSAPGCQDPKVSVVALASSGVVAKVHCGYPAPGKYVFKVSLDGGFAEGWIKSKTVRVA